MVFFRGARSPRSSDYNFRESFAGFTYLVLKKKADDYTMQVLEQNVPYFRKLNDRQKEDFGRRVKCFVAGKKFEGHDGAEVTEEDKILAAACFVMITFGMNHPSFARFDKIIFYPDKFYSRYGKAWHRGETNPGKKYVAFSLKDFRASFNGTYSEVGHLGLHEAAHAVKVQNLMSNEDYDQYFKKYFDKWKVSASRKKEKIRSGQSEFLRDYAAANHHEFFAVATEQFFMDPEGFKAKLPNLYSELSIILNQDPVKNKEQLTGTREQTDNTASIAPGKMGEPTINLENQSSTISQMPPKGFIVIAFAGLLIVLSGFHPVFLVLGGIIIGGSFKFAIPNLKNFYFYDNGIQISSSQSWSGEEQFIPFEWLSFVTFYKAGDRFTYMEIASQEKPGLKKKRYPFTFGNKEAECVQKLLKDKKVPVFYKNAPGRRYK